MKIVLLGPPHSGKSCVAYGLKQLLGRMPGLPRPYPIDTTPDGEGSWFQPTAHRFERCAEELKSRKKRPFDWPWTMRAVGWVKKCPLPLVLADTGGKMDAKLAVICRHATHAILVAPEGTDCDDWLAFIEGMGLSLIALVRSSLRDDPDSAGPAAGTKPPELTIHGLQRGNDLSGSPAVRWIAKRISGTLIL